MDLSPKVEEHRLLLRDCLHRLPQLAMFHSRVSKEFRKTVGPNEADFGFAVTNYVDMRRRVIIDIDHDPQSERAQYDNHAAR
jgi:hypothetical protein